MKLNSRDAQAYLHRPDPKLAGALIYGADPMRVSDARVQLCLALAGPEADQDMRLVRLNASDLRKDPAALLDEIKARGFFAGARVVVVEEAGDTLAKPLTSALGEWQDGDAYLIVTAGQLTPRNGLRKLFEGARNANCIALYDEPMSREAIEHILHAAGLTSISRDAQEALTGLARGLEPGDFRQTVEKIALYKLGDSTPLTPEEVEACAPLSAEAELDELLHIVAEGRSDALHSVLQRLYAQGVLPVGLCIGALRHFRALHQAASHPDGAGAGVARLRPPVFGPRRDRMQRQASAWGALRLEGAIATLLETDLALRSSTRAPQMALVERALIRIAMQARR